MRLLSVARDLQRRQARERRALFVAEGHRAVQELLRSTLTIRGVLRSSTDEKDTRLAEILATLHERGVPVQEVTPTDLASAADTESPQGILAIAEVPKHSLTSLTLADPLRIVVLDALQDPGNAGTIVRTAAALGAAATLAMPGTVDLWNAKVVRSSMGALFHHPAFGCTWPELSAFLSDREVSLWAADASGDSLETFVRGRSDVPPRVALVVGNEGSGLSSETRRRADRFVALPITTAVESLNVAVATGIILYELRP